MTPDQRDWAEERFAIMTIDGRQSEEAARAYIDQRLKGALSEDTETVHRARKVRVGAQKQGDKATLGQDSAKKQPNTGVAPGNTADPHPFYPS